jgi:hypothetical protein
MDKKLNITGLIEEQVRILEELNKITIQIANSLTPAELGRIAGRKQYEKGIGMFARSKEQQLKDSSEAGKKGGKKNVESGHIAKLNSVTQSCPTCGRDVKGYAGFYRHTKFCKNNG